MTIQRFPTDMSQKTTPIPADLVLIADSADSNNAKYATISSILITPVKSKTADYTLLPTDETINCTANSFTLTLPTAVGCSGKKYNLKNSGSGTITINTTSSQTVDGNASGVVIVPPLNSKTVQSDGANWIII